MVLTFLQYLHILQVGKETGYGIATKTMQKRTPEEVGTLRGFFLCLLALAVTVKPLADVVGNYTCCDRHKETG